MATTSILFDNEGLSLLKATPTIPQALYWAEILIPKNDFTIRAIAERSFGMYTEEELKYFYLNTSGRKIAPTMMHGALVQGLIDLCGELPVDNTSVDDLKAQLGRPLPKVSTKPVPTTKREVQATRSAAKLNRPKEGTATGKVWSIADSFKTSEAIPDKKAVVAACVEQGINPSTAAVQFSKWKRFIEAGN